MNVQMVRAQERAAEMERVGEVPADLEWVVQVVLVLVRELEPAQGVVQSQEQDSVVHTMEDLARNQVNACGLASGQSSSLVLWGADQS